MTHRTGTQPLETQTRADWDALKLDLLKTHLQHAYQRSPYYRASFDAAGVHPDQVNSLDDLRRFPFIDKQAMRERQLAVPPFGDLVAVPERDVVYISASSGSTGVPTASPFTARDFDDWIDYEARQFWSSGLRPADRYCHSPELLVVRRRSLRTWRAEARRPEHSRRHPAVRASAADPPAVPGDGDVDHAVLRLVPGRDRKQGRHRSPARPRGAAHLRRRRTRWLDPRDADPDRGPVGRVGLRLLRAVGYLRLLRRHVRGEGRAALGRGPHPGRGSRPRHG